MEDDAKFCEKNRCEQAKKMRINNWQKKDADYKKKHLDEVTNCESTTKDYDWEAELWENLAKEFRQ